MKIGDRVRIFGKHDMFREQSGDGDGTVSGNQFNKWVIVRWDNGHVNGYPMRVLEVLGDGTMPDPEFDLEEINQGSELYRKLEGR